MAADINDTVVLGFGSWSSVNWLPTLGYAIRSTPGTFELVAAQTYVDGLVGGEVYLDGHIASQIYVDGLIAGETQPE